MRSAPRTRLTLYGRDGLRKYLTPDERSRFMAAAISHPRAEVATFCLMLAHTGCRISEALAVRGIDMEIAERFVAVNSLKKRNDVLIREIPLPDDFTARVASVHADRIGTEDRLWCWSRSRAWRLVKSVMLAADIRPGSHRTAKGLRHGFGIHAIRCGIPLNMVQRWLGHASIATTAIYTNALGIEERELAQRLWAAVPPSSPEVSVPLPRN